MASLEADASNVLSGSGRLLWPTTDSETLSKDPKCVFWFVRDKIGKIKENKCVHSADFAANKSKHTVGDFVQRM